MSSVENIRPKSSKAASNEMYNNIKIPSSQVQMKPSIIVLPGSSIWYDEDPGNTIIDGFIWTCDEGIFILLYISFDAAFDDLGLIFSTDDIS
jgi:hypothetical protein